MVICLNLHIFFFFCFSVLIFLFFFGQLLIAGHFIMLIMEHRIYFSVCGEGYGHSSRAISIARKLESTGVNILMGSYGYAQQRLKTFYPAVNIQKEFEMIAKEGAFDLKATLLQSKNSALNYSGIISGEKKAMGDFSATCVVSDGRIAPVLAAFKLGIPCVVISNQTSIGSFFTESSFLVHLLGKPIEFSLKTSMELADVVLIPDFPPPYTVCLLYTSDAADDLLCVDLGGRRII